MFWTTVAYAMGGAGTGAGGAAGGEPAGFGLIPIALMFAVFYFLLFRPQQKRNKEHKAMQASLKRGDEVVTAGGIFGRIHEITDEYAILDVGGGVKIKVLRSSVSTASSALAKGPAKKAAKKDEPKDAKKDEPKEVRKDDVKQVEKGEDKEDAPKSE